MALFQPLLNFNFVVSMWDVEASLFGSSMLGTVAGAAGSAILGGFSEVHGLNADLEIETYDEGGVNDGPHRYVKRTRFPNLVFRSGVSPNPSIWDWYRQVASGSGKRKRKSGLVMVMERGSLASEAGPLAGMLRPPIALWSFVNGYPERLQGPALNARGNEVAIETLEIAHEGLERLSPAMIPGIGAAFSAIGI